MSLYHRIHTLMSFTTGTTTDHTGKAFSIIPGNEEPEFRVFVDLEQSGGSGGPTTTLHVETSYDGHWIPVIDPIQLNSDMSVHKFIEVSALGPLVRARTVLGGSTKPTHTATVKLAGTGAFTISAKTTTHNTTSDTNVSPVVVAELPA